jgi:hypothetical protein
MKLHQFVGDGFDALYRAHRGAAKFLNQQTHVESNAQEKKEGCALNNMDAGFYSAFPVA